MIFVRTKYQVVMIGIIKKLLFLHNRLFWLHPFCCWKQDKTFSKERNGVEVKYLQNRLLFCERFALKIEREEVEDEI